MKKIVLLFNTIKYLKLKQLVYRVYYLLRNKYRKLFSIKYPLKICTSCKELSLSSSITMENSYFTNNCFIFLNKKKQFSDKIDWNFSNYGKLWLYNLTYFEYLQQKDISKEEGLRLIDDFIHNSEVIKDGMMPFPISLRGLNWIKFLTYHQINNEKINNALYTQYYILLDNLEYHILGNHLLENAFSLLFGAYYFNDNTLHSKAKKILITELNEQILEDGAHFELTPMYHQLMLFRLLDCINLIQNNLQERDKNFLKFLISKASIMLGWLENITFLDGSIPLCNDSTIDIAPTSDNLYQYAKRLGIKTEKKLLKESGYRKFIASNYESIIDIGDIGPDYIPGHAHADTLSFILYVDNLPFIVDTGISTYENNSIRAFERSTAAHNTVVVDGQNQSQVWDGFRVANRAKIIQLVETDSFVKATHDGYKSRGVLHTRSFTFNDNLITVEDYISSSDEVNKHVVMAFIHFHPDVKVEVNSSYIKCNDCYTIKFTNLVNLELDTYNYPLGYNKYAKASYIKVAFTKNLKMEIKI